MHILKVVEETTDQKDFEEILARESASVQGQYLHLLKCCFGIIFHLFISPILKSTCTLAEPLFKHVLS